MEESAERRERLKAMRMEASQSQEGPGPTYNEGGEQQHSAAVSLANPLVEPTTTADPPSGQMLGQSFNYYTNPMAAYSGNNKQKTKVSPQISHDYPPRPQINEPHLNHSPIPRMQPPHGQYQNPNFSYTPNTPQVQSRYPSPGGYRGPHFTSGPGSYPSPGQGSYPRPGQGSYPSSGSGYPLPDPSLGRGYGYPGPRPHFRASLDHGSGSGVGYPTSTSGANQGRGQWFGNSVGSSSGRGRGRWSGQGGGRGAHNNHVTAEDRPDLFYSKSMVEDPWKFLEPVIWKSHKKPKPWNLYSSNTKKPRVSEPPTGSQPSLAEILAASFNEAASGEPDAGL